ncbi:hypothetical protein LCGC14_1442010 [marine sediment metagenome]|uniref:Uncharacterized protein n=1 Tax=marine sediment metagenome TaxID=412755 RepID=A0A0F9JL39_9ZZZZ
MPGTQPTAVVKIEANIQWKMHRDPETHTFTGVCEALHLNAVGDTWKEFQECANEAMELLFVDLFEDGELEQFLRINGWQLLTPLPARGQPEPQFDVPFSLDRTASVEDLVPA